MTHVARDWGWCYVVYKREPGKITWNVLSVSCKAAVLSGTAGEWCAARAVWWWVAALPGNLIPPSPPPSSPLLPPSTLPPQVHSLCNRPSLARTGCKIFSPCSVIVKFNLTDVIYMYQKGNNVSQMIAQGKYLLDRLWIATSASGKLVRPCLCPASTSQPPLFRDPRQGLRM